MVVAPTGIVTFLFTDIEGSTRRWEHHPALMHTAFHRQEAILRQIIAGHGGFAYKMIGDAFQAAFQHAADALAAGIAAQQAIAAESWGALGPLRIRMAIHTGAAEERGDDYVGPQLNRVARLVDAAHGGQILLTVDAWEHVKDQLPPGITLRDMGCHRLKDLIRPEHIFQVAAPGLPVDFPALHTLDAHRTDLPIPPTPLIGREHELALLRSIMADPEVRLLTLTGPGGIGKTRLALQLGAELRDAFPGGVYFVALAPTRDSALVGTAIAQGLGVKEIGEQPIADSLTAFLRDKRLLLIVDNFEQVAAAAPLLGELLASAHGIKLIVTSRAVLRLQSEYEFAVPTLALPPDGARATEPSQPERGLEALAEYAAVRLFVARARAANRSFAVTAANAAQVAEICRRLDGLPLAIELAAAWTKLLGPQALLARLAGANGHSPLRLLTGGAHDLPARHQTLRNAIAWSYELLGPGEQALFRQLAVFAGGCSLEAAVGVLSFEQPVLSSDAGELNTQHSEPKTLAGLTTLVEQSLLGTETQADGEPRFVMLETIREFAIEQLQASGTREALRQQHAQYFAELAERADAHLSGADQRIWLEQLVGEQENLRAALVWTLELHQAPELGTRLVAALVRFWWQHGPTSEGRRWIATALEQAGGVAQEVRARLLYRAAYLAWRQGDYAQASRWSSAGLALCQTLGDITGQAWSHGLLGRVALRHGDGERAVSELAASLDLFRSAGEGWGYAWALSGMGQAELARGDLDAAQRYWGQSLDQFAATGDIAGRARVMGSLGQISWRRGDAAGAVAALKASLALYDELGDTADQAWTLNDLGDVARWQRDYRQATEWYNQSLSSFNDLGDRQGCAAVLHNLGHIALVQGNAAAAYDRFAKSLAIFHSIGHLTSTADCLVGLAGTATLARHAERAAQLLGVAMGLHERIDSQATLISPANRSELERIAAEAEAQLGAEGYTHAWNSGRALPLDQAIARALEEARG